MNTIKSAFKILFKHPILILPLFMTWSIIAYGVVYFKYDFPWSSYSSNQQFLIVYLFYFIASFSILFSNSILVELLEQDEFGYEMSLKKAIWDSTSKNLIRIFLLATLFSIIWFILVILKVLLSKKKNEGSDERSARNIALTLAGEESLSWSTFTIDMLIQALRMTMFIIFPAIAWENKNVKEAIKRGLNIIKNRTTSFVDGFIISLGAQFFLYLPPSIMFLLSEKFNVHFDEIWWVLNIIYSGFAWSFTLYIEQLFGTELFLWNLKYEHECALALEKKVELPLFEDVTKPRLLDGINDLELIRTSS